MSVPHEILRQLGGNKFIVMTGAVCTSDKNTLSVRFKGSRIANLMTVTLKGNDTYDVKFSKYAPKSGLVTPVKEWSDVYADMLRDIFESTTGLRTRI